MHGARIKRITNRLISGNASYHSLQNLLSSSLLPRNLKIKLYRFIILDVVLYGCGTSSLILREGRRLRVFENRVLRGMFVPQRDEVTWGEENYIMRSLIVCTAHPMSFGW